MSNLQLSPLASPSSPQISSTAPPKKTSKQQPPLKRSETFPSLPTPKGPQPVSLNSPEDMHMQIESVSSEKMQENHGKLVGFLKRQKSSLNLFQDMIDKGMKHSDLDVLPDVEVDKTSEFSRTLEQDTRETLQGLKNMSPEAFSARKAAAYKHPEVLRDKDKAIESGHYGSERHKQYGILVSTLTAGIITPEEAMAMNPSGGIPGPGLKEVPLLGRFDSVVRHALRHDATGFLLTRFNVGPGYGTPTTPLGLDKDNPLAGQWLGILREVKTASVIPDVSQVGQPLELA